MDEYIDARIQAPITKKERTLKNKFLRLLSSDFDLQPAECHATILSEYWAMLKTSAAFLEKFAAEPKLRVPSDEDAPDFVSDMTSELIYFEANLADIKKTVDQLARAAYKNTKFD